MIDTLLAMSQYPDGRTHTFLFGRLITQHGDIDDSHWIRDTFGALSSRPSAKDGHRHVDNERFFLYQL